MVVLLVGIIDMQPSSYAGSCVALLVQWLTMARQGTHYMSSDW